MATRRRHDVTTQQDTNPPHPEPQTMKLTFLGGANEVGASCTLLEVAGKRILIDAGIRMGAKEADSLPNLSHIQEGGPLDAILLNTSHSAWRTPDFAAWRAAGVRAVVDGRNFWARSAAENAGLIYLAVGDGRVGA